MKPHVYFASFLALAVCAGGAQAVHAQADRRFEVGGQIVALSLSDSETTNAGFGGRLSYDVLPWLAAETELNLFGNDTFEQAPVAFPGFGLTYSRTRFDGFFGAKIGMRRDRFGLYGKIRPGFTRLFDKGIACTGEVCALILVARPEYRTEFALDLGGVVEFYPTARTVTRLDLGTTVIDHRSSAPPCTDCTTRNFTTRIGMGWRF